LDQGRCSAPGCRIGNRKGEIDRWYFNAELFPSRQWSPKNIGGSPGLGQTRRSQLNTGKSEVDLLEFIGLSVVGYGCQQIKKKPRLRRTQKTSSTQDFQECRPNNVLFDQETLLRSAFEGIDLA
jgi:hypothetical protein